MRKYKNYFLMACILLFMPYLVFAVSSNSPVDFGTAIFIEVFMTIFMSIFVLKPLANLISNGNSKKTYNNLFYIRIGLLLYCNFFITPSIFVIDIFLFFIGAFLIVPIMGLIMKKNPYAKIDKSDITLIDPNDKGAVYESNLATIRNQNTITLNANLKCVKCGILLNSTNKFCTNCGAPIETSNALMSEKKKVLVHMSDFDPMYNKSEELLLEEFINKEIVKANIDKNSKLIPSAILKRKNILNIIFSVLVFVYVSLIFFHFPVYTYIIGIILLYIFLKYNKKYTLMDYLKKEIKARPSEKISNIVMNVKNSFVEDKSLKLKKFSLIIAIILPLIIFINPRIMYEEVKGGYAVRFYTFGVTNFTTAKIPKRYKGEDVVSLRGNTFSNMPFLREVKLPDTITEIRGQAFKNDISLKKVNIPSNLEYLGGGAFYNCSSIKSVSLPDTLTYMGGEVFYGASSLKEIKLSENLSEIRGNSFEECESLESIEIPDNVERIGGHAFYGATSLSEVTLTENSKLNEIGSSAFRRCDNLKSITLPYGVSVNPKAFKESPTIVSHFNTNYDRYYSSN